MDPGTAAEGFTRITCRDRRDTRGLNPDGGGRQLSYGSRLPAASPDWCNASMATDPGTAGVLDLLVARVLGSYPYRFTVPSSEEERQVGYRIRCASSLASGWVRPEDFQDGLEHDAFDHDAIQVIGWLGDEAVATGRLVLPPGRLPTEQTCDIVVEPRGQVVEVGRMAVTPAHQSHQHAAFIALLCRLYLQMRNHGFEVACGMMSPRVRGLLNRLGLQLQVLGPDREYWGEQRCPVRFALTVNALSLPQHWPPDTTPVNRSQRRQPDRR